MRLLLATVAAGALMGTAVLAQDAADTAIYSVTEGDYYASNLIGSRLYTTESDLADEVIYADVSGNWNDVGEINDFVVGEDGSVQAVIVGVGGFLGIGEKDVAVTWDDVSATYDDDGSRFLVVSMTQDALENSPAFEYEELDSDVGQASAMDGQDAGADATAEAAATDVATETDAAATDAQTAEADAVAPEATSETAMGDTDVNEASEAATDLAEAEADRRRRAIERDRACRRRAGRQCRSGRRWGRQRHGGNRRRSAGRLRACGCRPADCRRARRGNRPVDCRQRVGGRNRPAHPRRPGQDHRGGDRCRRLSRHRREAGRDELRKSGDLPSG